MSYKFFTLNFTVLRRNVTVLITFAVLINLTALSSMLSSPLLAEELPDAGKTLRELERYPATQPPSREKPNVKTPKEQVPLKKSSSTEPRLRVSEFVVTGAKSFSAIELALLLQSWRNKNLTLNELQEAAAVITQFYRKKGFLVARAYIPAQTLNNGVVQIAVIEGQLGQLHINGNIRMPKERTKAFLKDLKPNEPLKQQTIEHELLSLNGLAGIKHVGATLQPGESTGLADLAIAVEPAPFISGSVDVDNHGSRFTGSERLGATLFVNSPLYLGDLFSARLITSDADLRYGKMTYNRPVGYNGLSLGIAYLESSYRLGKEFAILDANGNAEVVSLLAHYPLFLSRTDKINLEFSIDHKSLTDKIDGLGSVENKSLNNATLGLIGRKEGPGFIANFSLNYTNGYLDIKTPKSRELDAISAQTQGAFGLWTLSAGGVLAILDRWELHSSFNGQMAQKNLNSSEKFALGGAGGVRAYPQGETSSDEGYVTNIEVRYAIPTRQLGVLQVGLFTDYGRARINDSPYILDKNTRELLSAGLSLNWKAPFAVLLQGCFAWDLGNEQPRAESERSPRSWIQLQKYF